MNLHFHVHHAAQAAVSVTKCARSSEQQPHTFRQPPDDVQQHSSAASAKNPRHRPQASRQSSGKTSEDPANHGRRTTARMQPTIPMHRRAAMSIGVQPHNTPHTGCNSLPRLLIVQRIPRAPATVGLALVALTARASVARPSESSCRWSLIRLNRYRVTAGSAQRLDLP